MVLFLFELLRVWNYFMLFNSNILEFLLLSVLVVFFLLSSFLWQWTIIKVMKNKMRNVNLWRHKSIIHLWLLNCDGVNSIGCEEWKKSLTQFKSVAWKNSSPDSNTLTFDPNTAVTYFSSESHSIYKEEEFQWDCLLNWLGHLL